MADESKVPAGGFADDQVKFDIRRNGEFLEIYLNVSPQHAPILVLTVIEEAVSWDRSLAADFTTFVKKVTSEVFKRRYKLTSLY